ncbi:MAG: hypothetical protein KKA60_04920, partial [Proteobacteria bacterium]|nr:hypothetical protein [Pseudomonadota bacterium]
MEPVAPHQACPLGDASKRILARRGVVECAGLTGPSRAWFLASLFARAGRSLLVVAPTEKEALSLLQDLEFFL